MCIRDRFWTITCEAEKREPAQRAAALERAQAIDRAKDAAARTARPSGAHYRCLLYTSRCV